MVPRFVYIVKVIPLGLLIISSGLVLTNRCLIAATFLNQAYIQDVVNDGNLDDLHKKIDDIMQRDTFAE